MNEVNPTQYKSMLFGHISNLTITRECPDGDKLIFGSKLVPTNPVPITAMKRCMINMTPVLSTIHQRIDGVLDINNHGEDLYNMQSMKMLINDCAFLKENISTIPISHTGAVEQWELNIHLGKTTLDLETYMLCLMSTEKLLANSLGVLGINKLYPEIIEIRDHIVLIDFRTN